MAIIHIKKRKVLLEP